MVRNGREENQLARGVGKVVVSGGGEVDGLNCEEWDDDRTCDPVVFRASAAVDDPPESGGVEGDVGIIVKDDRLLKCALEAGIGDL